MSSPAPNSPRPFALGPHISVGRTAAGQVLSPNALAPARADLDTQLAGVGSLLYLRDAGSTALVTPDHPLYQLAALGSAAAFSAHLMRLPTEAGLDVLRSMAEAAHAAWSDWMREQEQARRVGTNAIGRPQVRTRAVRDESNVLVFPQRSSRKRLL